MGNAAAAGRFDLGGDRHRHWLCIAVVWGHWSLLSKLCVFVVSLLFLVAIGYVVLLQSEAAWHARYSEWIDGFSLGWPVGNPFAALSLAFGTFGILGVGAAELIAYPYWCQEKGYMKWLGAPDGSMVWFDRAHGWLRVLQLDAWVALVAYTVVTLVFFMLGAATMHRVGMRPPDGETVRTLLFLCGEIFNPWLKAGLLGSMALAMVTALLVLSVGQALVFTDAISIAGWVQPDEGMKQRWIRVLRTIVPLMSVAIYVVFPKPAFLLLTSGIAQGLMLPVLAGGALYLRHQRLRSQLRPGTVWDVCLGLSAFAMLVTGVWTLVAAVWKLENLWQRL